MIKRSALVCGIILLCFAASAQIEGDVTDSTRKGIAHALVIAIDSNKLADSVTTDSRGFYEFKKLKKGKYTIEIKAAGFQPISYKDVEVVKEISDRKTGRNDMSSATRLDIILIAEKSPTRKD